MDILSVQNCLVHSRYLVLTMKKISSRLSYNKGGLNLEAKQLLLVPRDQRCNIALSVSLQGCSLWGKLLCGTWLSSAAQSPSPEGCRAKQGADLTQWLHRLVGRQEGRKRLVRDQLQQGDALGKPQMASHTERAPGCSLVWVAQRLLGNASLLLVHPFPCSPKMVSQGSTICWIQGSLLPLHPGATAAPELGVG